MGTKVRAVTAVDTYHRLIYLVIPEHRSDNAGIPAVATANALIRVNVHSASLSRCKGLRWTYLRAGRIFTRLAYNYSESPFPFPRPISRQYRTRKVRPLHGFLNRQTCSSDSRYIFLFPRQQVSPDSSFHCFPSAFYTLL